MKWTLLQKQYDELNNVHCDFLKHCIGWNKRTRADRPLSYIEALLETDSSETLQATVRKRRLLSLDSSYAWETTTDPRSASSWER